jgi:hypothetical protein
MLEVARAKFNPNEMVEFQPADATAPASFDTIVCQFGVIRIRIRAIARRTAG